MNVIKVHFSKYADKTGMKNLEGKLSSSISDMTTQIL